MKQDLIGRFRHKITFQSESESADSGGGYTLSWTNVSTVWAEVKPLASSRTSAERLQAGQLEDKVIYKVTTRYLSGITPKMRILFGTRVFNIRSVINLGEKDELLEIIADEGSAV